MFHSAQVASLASADYDGDGRADIQIFDGQGQLKAYIGNTGTGRTRLGLVR